MGRWKKGKYRERMQRNIDERKGDRRKDGQNDTQKEV